MKKIKLMLVAFMAMVGVNAMAVDYADGYLRYSLTGSNATITGFVANQERAAVEIPATVADPTTGLPYNVVAIGPNAFLNKTIITSLTIADENVATIDNSAFKGCTNLATVTIGSAVTTIGTAFEGCTKLETVTFNEAAADQTIAAGAFLNTAVKSLNLTPTKLATIQPLFTNGTVTSNATLTEVRLPYYWTAIVGNAFKGCEALATVDFPELDESVGVQTIGAGAFSGTAIKDLDLRNTNVAVLNALFGINGTLEKVELPATLTTIEESAFENAAKLNSVDLTLCGELYIIKDYAFGTTPSLKSLDFQKCASLSHFTQTGAAGGTGTNPFVSYDGAKFIKNTALTTLKLNNTKKSGKTKTITIGTALANLAALTSVNIDETSIAAFGAGAFDNDAALESLTFPSSTTTIGGTAAVFAGCTKLATLTIPGTVTTIGGTASLFDDAAKAALTTLKITGDCAAGFGAKSFDNCTAISTLEISKGKTFSGTPVTGAIVVAEGATVTFGDIAILVANEKAGFVQVGDGTKAATVTFGKITTALTKQIVSSSKSDVTIGAVTITGVSFDVFGVSAKKLTFKGDITGALAAYSAINTSLEEIDFGSINMAADAIPSASNLLTESAAANAQKVAITWKPLDFAATKAFAQDAFGVVGSKNYKQVTLTTTTAVATLYAFTADNLYNVVFAADAATDDITVAAPEGSKWFYGKHYNATKDYRIAKEQDGATVIVYSGYVDASDQAIYMEQLHIYNGYYYIPKGNRVIVKSTSSTAVKADPFNAGEFDSMIYGDPDGNGTYDVLNDIQRLGTDKIGQTWKNENPGKDIYVMAKTSKYGLKWMQVGDDTTVKTGNFYILTDQINAASLRIVWTDGSEESEATAIQSVKTAKAENGAIYNLAGQKVSASYKGVVIKDGKKYIQK